MKIFKNMLKTRPFTITRHDDKSKIVNVTTTEDRFFKIEHVKNIPESGSNNYYGDISFKGDGKFNPCVFEHKITVK